MKLLIAVPSKNRPLQLTKHVLRWLQYTKSDWKVFIEPQDEAKYKDIPVLKGHGVVIHENNRGLGYAKLCIQEYAVENGYDLVFKLDDDTQGWANTYTRGMGRNAPLYSWEWKCEKLFEPIMKNSIKLLKEFEQVAAISLMYRNDMKSYSGDTWIGTNKRLQSCYIVRTEFLCPPYSEKNLVFEDFRTFLNILYNGYITVRYGLTGQDFSPVGMNKGGMQDFDRKTMCENTKVIMKKLYPEVVWKSVDKTWKWEPDFGKTIRVLGKKGII